MPGKCIPKTHVSYEAMFAGNAPMLLKDGTGIEYRLDEDKNGDKI